MAVYVRPFVKSIAHIEGCLRRHCGPQCKRETSGWEYHIKLVLPNGECFEERKKSPVGGKENTRRYAEALANEKVRESVSPAPLVSKEVPTVEGFKEKFLTYSRTNNKPSTVYAKEWMFRVHLSPHFGSMRLDRIGRAEIEAYKEKKLGEKLDKKSINNHLTALRKLVNLAAEYEVIDRPPKIRGFNLKPPFVSEDEYLNFDEAERFLWAAAPEWKVFLITAVKTGLRVGELLALKWQDIDLVACHLIVRRTLWRDQEGPPKGGRDRKIPLGDQALTALKGHRHLQGPYVFCDETGARLSHSMVKDVVPAACKRAGLGKRITTHGLRHYAGSVIMPGWLFVTRGSTLIPRVRD